jgi:hypothetical protein
VVDQVLRQGAARLFWTIDSFIHRVDPGYEYFARRLVKAQGQWNVITFNWDTLVERALTEIDGEWSYSRDDARNKTVLVKPHGSINWSSFAQQKLIPDYAGWKPIAPGSTLSYDSEHPLANPDKQEINPDLRWCLYPGDSDLPEDHADIARLWGDARALIAAADRVVFIGYSLPAYDTYASKVLVELCETKHIEVYDPSHTTRLRYQQVLPQAELHDATFTRSPFAQREGVG